jgi:pimeloyl-ACP methyl ester carboxylesterase
LIGHSLGARVIFFAGENWPAHSIQKLKNVLLLGGAIPKSRDWSRVASNLSGNLFNIYNSSDLILKNLFRASSLGLFPCGLREIESRHSRIYNFNVTASLGESHDHAKYLGALVELSGNGVIDL